jgi:hypothetical protein
MYETAFVALIAITVIILISESGPFLSPLNNVLKHSFFKVKNQFNKILNRR